MSHPLFKRGRFCVAWQTATAKKKEGSEWCMILVSLTGAARTKAKPPSSVQVCNR